MDKKELLEKLFDMVNKEGFTEEELAEIEELGEEELVELIDSLEE